MCNQRYVVFTCFLCTFVYNQYFNAHCGELLGALAKLRKTTVSSVRPHGTTRLPLDEVILKIHHAFLWSTLDGGEMPASRSVRCPSGGRSSDGLGFVRSRRGISCLCERTFFPAFQLSVLKYRSPCISLERREILAVMLTVGIDICVFCVVMQNTEFVLLEIPKFRELKAPCVFTALSLIDCTCVPVGFVEW